MWSRWWNYKSSHLWVSLIITDMGACSNPNPATIVPYHESLCEHWLSFLEENDIEDPELDKDPYPWIMWYIWKARNDKLFRGIDRDPLETVWHAESECHAWFEANIKQEEQTVRIIPEQITNSERCLIDSSWTHDAFFSGYGWTWKTSGGTT